MTDTQSAGPAVVLRYADEARRYVRNALAFALDGTPDTISVLDHYLRQIAGEAPDIVRLVSVAAGCYFGELVRVRYAGIWEIDGDAPEAWQLLVPQVGLRFSPVAVARQAIAQGADEASDDSLRVSPEVRPVLTQALDRLAPMPQDVYYDLANRWDTLETVIDLLVEMARRRRADGGDGEGPARETSS